MRQTTRLVDRRRAAQIHLLFFNFIPLVTKTKTNQKQKALNQLKTKSKAIQTSQKTNAPNK